jgi:hypothetical protein
VKRNIVSFLFCICLFFVAGCATVGTIKYTSTRYAPTDANKIEVFSSAIPKKEYIELAEITLSSGRNLKKVKAKAAKLGADAIILTGPLSLQATKSSFFFIVNEDVEQIGLRCIAIKFK